MIALALQSFQPLLFTSPSHVPGMQLSAILQSDWGTTIVDPAQLVQVADANDTRPFTNNRKVKGRQHQTNRMSGALVTSLKSYHELRINDLYFVKLASCNTVYCSSKAIKHL